MNAVIFLNYKNYSVKTLGINLMNAGMDIEQVVIVKEKGIANAINIGLNKIDFSHIQYVGAFNTALDPYGAIDLDYCTRVRAAGLYTKYISSDYATHIEQNGLDAYGYAKSDLVKSTWDLHTSNVANYSNGSKTYYLPL